MVFSQQQVQAVEQQIDELKLEVHRKHLSEFRTLYLTLGVPICLYLTNRHQRRQCPPIAANGVHRAPRHWFLFIVQRFFGTSVHPAWLCRGIDVPEGAEHAGGREEGGDGACPAGASHGQPEPRPGRPSMAS
jgi:hypothetical protein